jgi:hypothetical protein
VVRVMVVRVMVVRVREVRVVRVRMVSIRNLLSAEPRINACSVPPACGLFLTCTEGMFSFLTEHTYTHYNITHNIMGC